ncbi:MAG: NADP-specific glutamate dehydrogenase [Oleibacter sp.]|nr:NADP-specific glutamate dehydrogenase [Thalassolituus sp.]
MADFREIYRDYLEKNHPGSDEFHQAVEEIFEDIKDEYHNDDQYDEWNVLERLMEPDRIIRFRVCWEADDGKVKINTGWRVQFHNLLGAYKGGLRFHPSVNESVLKFLGFEQCFKNALTGMPMGGGKGGSNFNPKGCSQREIMRFCQAFMRELYRHIGSQTDVPAGDINVGSTEIGYLFGEYIKIKNQWEGVLTGKNPSFGGSCGREEATGYGVIYFLKNMLKAHDKELKEKRILISGSGNVALHAAKKAIQEDAIVLSISDSGGTLYFENGMKLDDFDTLYDFKINQKGRLKDAKIGSYMEGDKPWIIKEADIALPCATQNELDEDDATELLDNGIKILCEGANMPLTDGARKKFINAKALYGPAKAANAGGVAVSGLERSQNAELNSWDIDRIDKELQSIMENIHDRCIQYVKKENDIYPYSKGANIYGFKKLAGAMIAQGIV